MPKGLATHAAVGLALTIVLALFGAPAGATFVAVYAVGLAHEIGDGDLKRGAEGYPWNGLLDLAAFLPAPLFRLLVLG